MGNIVVFVHWWIKTRKKTMLSFIQFANFLYALLRQLLFSQTKFIQDKWSE